MGFTQAVKGILFAKHALANCRLIAIDYGTIRKHTISPDQSQAAVVNIIISDQRG